MRCVDHHHFVHDLQLFLSNGNVSRLLRYVGATVAVTFTEAVKRRLTNAATRCLMLALDRGRLRVNNLLTIAAFTCQTDDDRRTLRYTSRSA